MRRGMQAAARNVRWGRRLSLLREESGGVFIAGKLRSDNCASSFPRVWSEGPPTDYGGYFKG